MLDLHAHILPCVDDGAKDLDESLALLEMMKAQGITSVVATPHFYAAYDTVEDFQARISQAYKTLTAAAAGKDLPEILVGSEVLYYRYLGVSDSAHAFCLNGSDYLLLELSNDCIGNGLWEDIRNLQNRHITPIIAHIERYRHLSGYKQLIRFVQENAIPAQINASSLLMRSEFRTIRKLFEADVVTYLATDAHSATARPPMMQAALQLIAEKFGQAQADRLVQNSLQLFHDIKNEGVA